MRSPTMAESEPENQVKPHTRVWFARLRAAIWTASIIPAVLWWHNSVLFVIVASIYANVESGIAAAEAADDSHVLKQLVKLEEQNQELRKQNEEILSILRERTSS